MLTLVEYGLLLYRAFLPAPVWYQFFLNKEYGGLFSSLITGLYLTFKLTSLVEKVRSFYAALKALSRKEMHYGSYATLEQNRVLSYGIAGAVIFRLSLILLGTATLQRFEAVNLLLASILLYSSFKFAAAAEHPVSFWPCQRKRGIQYIKVVVDFGPDVSSERVAEARS